MILFKKIIVVVVLFVFCGLLPTTLVYNMRVRRAFNLPPFLQQDKSWYILTAVPIYFSRTSTLLDQQTGGHVFENRKAGGSLFNFRYVPSKYWWAEVTTGLEKDHGRFSGAVALDAQRVGFDDLVFSAGRRVFVKKSIQCVGYGLLGIPTKWGVSRDDAFGPMVGSRIFNVGIGAEISCSFKESLKHSWTVFGQGRIIHGFRRHWYPILPEHAKIIPGDFSDLLAAVQYRAGLTVMQVGYDCTRFSNQGVELPMSITTVDPFVRNSWFATIFHGFLDGLRHNPFVLGAGISGGSTARFDAKTITLWLTLTQLF